MITVTKRGKVRGRTESAPGDANLFDELQRKGETMAAVSDENLHFGTLQDDPTGVSDCDICNGTAVVGTEPCQECLQRQQLRNAWWTASGGPERLRETLRDL